MKTDYLTKSHERLLISLKYDDMNLRRNEVHQSFSEAFRWIFDRDSSHSWSSSPNWLHSDKTIYWVSGKPGSGKSTLMKYLIQNEKIIRELTSKKFPPILSYFLWNSGTIQQRSFQGLLASVLYQILVEDDSAIDLLLNGNHSKMKSAVWSLTSKITLGDWSVEDLETALMSCLRQSQYHDYIFLDGLDEIDKSYGAFDMAEFILRLSRLENIKLCISSRPWKEFRKSFGSLPRLQLDQLNYSDISRYVSEQLDEKLNAHYESSAARRLVFSLTSKAEGVFLWAVLATRKLRFQLGILTIDEIHASMEKLPADLEDLYESIWKRRHSLGKHFEAETAFYFHMLLEENAVGHGGEGFRPPHVFSATLSANYLGFFKIGEMNLVKDSDPNAGVLRESCTKIMSRITEFSAGMIKVSHIYQEVAYFHFTSHNSEGYENEDSESATSQHCEPDSETSRPISDVATKDTTFDDSDLIMMASMHMRWIHRTARDYFLGTEAGRNILMQDKTSPLGRHLAYCRSHLTLRKLRGGTYKQWSGTIKRYHEYLSHADLEVSHQKELLELIKETHLLAWKRVPSLNNPYYSGYDNSLESVLPFNHSLVYHRLLKFLQYRHRCETLVQPWPKKYVTELLVTAAHWENYHHSTGESMEVFVWLLNIGAHPYQKMSTGRSYLKTIPAATVTSSLVLKSKHSLRAYVEALKAFSLQNVVPNSRVLVKVQVVHALTRHTPRLQQSVFEGPYQSLDIYFDPWFIVLEVDLFSFLRVQLGMLEDDSWQQGRLDNWPASSTTYHAKPIMVQVRSNKFAFQWDGLDQMTNLPKLSQFCHGYGTRRFWTESDFGPAMKDEVNKWTETMPHLFSPIEYLKQPGFEFRESWNKEELYYRHSLKYHRKLELEAIQKSTPSGRDG